MCRYIIGPSGTWSISQNSPFSLISESGVIITIAIIIIIIVIIIEGRIQGLKGLWGGGGAGWEIINPYSLAGKLSHENERTTELLYADFILRFEKNVFNAAIIVRKA